MEEQVQLQFQNFLLLILVLQDRYLRKQVQVTNGLMKADEDEVEQAT